MTRLKYDNCYFYFDMPTIDLNEKIKEDLKKIKEVYGCKTYSEAVAILMRSNKIEEIMTNFFSHIMGKLTLLSQSVDEIKG
ncbi:MAG: hypothetical protein HWN79_17355 [Candidatus Lokiarchaeota archaeon]|nr:hypothetical protein [Candidatus Lokiarchaeota archaeon]